VSRDAAGGFQGAIAGEIPQAAEAWALQKQAGERTAVSRFVGWLRAEGVDKRPVFADRASYLPVVAAAFPEADLPAQICYLKTLPRRR
jgi:hypothetical protein